MPAKKPRKYINGIEHIQCCACSKWIPYDKAASNRSYKCADCYLAYKRAYKARIKDNPPKKRGNQRGGAVAESRLQLELQGLLPIHGGNLQGCTPEQIEILQSGSVEALLKMETRR